jgi:hypothetical protein
MEELFFTLINWYIGIGLFFLLVFEILAAIYEYYNKQSQYPDHDPAGKLTWRDRFATVMLWPNILYGLLKK